MNGSLELILFPIWGNLDGKIASTDHCMILTRNNNGVKQVELMKSVSFSLIMIVIFFIANELHIIWEHGYNCL